MINNKLLFAINNRSVKVRFMASLLANTIKMGLGFFTGLIVARGLGAANYGNYSFLLGSFTSITALLDMGTSSAFYTFLSQRKHSLRFYVYYISWLVIQFIFILILIAFIFPQAWRNKIWLGLPKNIIILSFLASFMVAKIWPTVMQTGEAIRATVVVQLGNVLLALFYFCIVLTMIFLNYFTISNLFVALTLTNLLFSLILAKKLKKDLIVEAEDGFSDVFDKYKSYCGPLAIYGLVGFAYSFADVWLLQKFGGAVEQGLYSVGYRFGAVCLIATTSILRIFWKEIAEANESGDTERLYYLYVKTSRSLCFVSAFGACFLIPFSKELLTLLGSEYKSGYICLAIMFIYPVYQSFGQINGSYFHATAQTHLHSTIGIIMMTVSVPVTYFVLAPSSNMIPGLGLGSMGLALKMVILAVVTVNISRFFICTRSNWSFDFLSQFIVIGLLLAASFVTKFFLIWVWHVLDTPFSGMLTMIFCVPIYILIAGVIIYLFPKLGGLERGQIKSFVSFASRPIKPKGY
jgi:O-antigen/teichoic acid export membrane protein